jgi:hypothetical protein
VKLAMGLIATMAALVLSLLIASANTSYDRQISQLKALSASIILLDRTLEFYGPGAKVAPGHSGVGATISDSSIESTGHWQTASRRGVARRLCAPSTCSWQRREARSAS